MTTTSKEKPYSYLKFCFIIPAALMLMGYLCRGIFPLGDNSVLALDLNAQYIYYFEAFRQAVYEGKSIFYSWSQSLSGEMIGIYGYYLSSPFTLIILLFPKEFITEAVLVMTVLKVGAAGLAFGYFLYKAKPMYRYYVVTLSVAYAMMSYMIVNAMNPMWLDAVIYLPIVMLGVRYLVDRGKYGLYFGALALTMFANYYIGYMVCIFTALYFVAYLISTDQIQGFKLKCRRFFLFAGVSVLAACAAAVIILPIYYSLTLGKMDFTPPNYDVYLRYNFLELLPKLLINSYDSVNVQGMPFIYCTSLALLLLPLYFVTPQIKLKKKACMAGLLLVMFAIMNISITDIAMHGFRIPNWLNYRYSFTVSFLMLSASADALKYVEVNKRSWIYKTFALLLAGLAVVQFLQIEYVKPFGTIYLSIAVFAIYAIVLTYIRSGKNRETAATLLLGCMMIEVFSNALVTFEDINIEVWYSSRSSYTDFMAESRPVVDSVLESDTDLYRMEKTYHRTVNDPMALKMRGISHSTSTLNADALRFLERLGISQREHWSHYTHTTIAADSILGVKYILSKEPLTSHYVLKDTQGDISVYENPYVLPILVAVDSSYTKKAVGSSSPFGFQNGLLNAMLGESGVEYFKKLEITDTTTQNVTTSKSGFHYQYAKISENKTGSVTYTLESVGENPIYAFFQSDYSNVADLFVNDQFVSDYFNIETYCVMPIGEFSDGETVTVRMEVGDDGMFLRNNDGFFYYLDMELFEQAIARLQMNGVSITSFSETNIEGTVTTSEEENAIFTSIPYEGGWTIKVDGIPVEYTKGAQSLITFPVSGTGTHTISMSFIPPGLVLGAVISAFALLIFALSLLLGKLRKKERELALADAVDPEGVPPFPETEEESIEAGSALFREDAEADAEEIPRSAEENTDETQL